MTTQELKQYIDRVLGNNIRCLLPSYWWKRLFREVVDRVDEVEQSTSKLIDSKVEEVKMPIVESVDDLEKLELAKGRVAAVEKVGESETVKISDCYVSLNLEEDWGKYTIVKGVEEKDVILDKDVTVYVIFSASKGNIDKDAIQVIVQSGRFLYLKVADDKTSITSLEYVNKALSNGKYRAIHYSNAPDDYFTFYSEKPQPSLYIKGDSWERLAKESDLEGIEGGGGSESETKSDTITFILRLDENYNLIPSDEDKEHNKESFKKYTNDISAGNYRNMELQCFLNDVSPMCVSWDIAGYDFFIGGGTAYPVFYNVVLRRTMFPFDVYFTEEGEPYISPHVNVCGAEFIYYRPQSQSTVKDHNAKVFEQMNKSFLNLFFVQQTKNGSEIANVTASCVYIKYEDYFLIQVPSGSTTDAFKLTSDGLITQMASQSSIDDALSTTSQRAVQNKVVTAALNYKVDKNGIKTINGESILGSGDITISGGGVSEDYVNTAIAAAITTTLNTEV